MLYVRSQLGAGLEQLKKLLTPPERDHLIAGLRDVLMEKTVDALDPASLEASALRVNILLQTRIQAQFDSHQASVAATLAAAAAEPGAVTTASGMVMRTLVKGTGAAPVAANYVRVQYEGKLLDGTVFDSSDACGAPAEFPSAPRQLAYLRRLSVCAQVRLVNSCI